MQMFASYTVFLFVYYKVCRLVYMPVWHFIGVCFKPVFSTSRPCSPVRRCDQTVKMDPGSVLEKSSMMSHLNGLTGSSGRAVF